MRYLTTNFITKFLFSFIAGGILVIAPGLSHFSGYSFSSQSESQLNPTAPLEVTPLQPSSVTALPFPTLIPPQAVAPNLTAQTQQYAFGNPAGCSETQPTQLTSGQMLINVQNLIGTEYNLIERRESYIWNGNQGVRVDVTQDPFVFEFVFNEFQHPVTYRADKIATIFMTNGFVVWFREYDLNFRLMAIPMIPGVLQSKWGEYVQAYWQKNGLSPDEHIYPVMKKLPCHWVIDEGYVSNETLASMFNLDWQVPDYLSAGRQYLASTCSEAYRISQEKVGYPDASTMCGPLAWIITRDVNGFPYRIGSWTADAGTFTGANPKWNNLPWGGFDPETFTLMHTDDPMPGYDFAARGNLYPGDLLYSYTSLYRQANDPHFDHIFLVMGINENNTRVSITNMIRNSPNPDCSITEVQLYTPGDRANGVINYEWNDHGFGITGSGGFDIFRWNWITYHRNGQPVQYIVRWGDTIDTIAFDWKTSPESILQANQLPSNGQLVPGQLITLPAITDLEDL